MRFGNYFSDGAPTLAPGCAAQPLLAVLRLLPVCHESVVGEDPLGGGLVLQLNNELAGILITSDRLGNSVETGAPFLAPSITGQ